MGQRNDGGDSGLLDFITRIDELIVNRVIPEIRNVRDAIANIDSDITVEEATFREGEPDTFQIEFSTNVPSDDTVTIERQMPFSGRTGNIAIGFPQGANQAVGVQLSDESTGQNYFPRNPEDEYFASNDFFEIMPLVFDIEQNQTLRAEYVNNDPNESHFVNFMLTIKEGV